MSKIQSMILGAGQEAENKPAKKIVPTPAESSTGGSSQVESQVISSFVPDAKEPISPVVVAGQPQLFKSLSDVTNELYKDRVPSEQDLAKEKKREKARAVISAIADGTSAISNLIFASKGAQNVEQSSMSAANAKRYQHILDRRMKVYDKWDDARLAAHDRDRGFNQDLKTWDRSGKWHEDQVKTDNERFDYNKQRNDRLDSEGKDFKDKNYELNRRGQESQEKAQKDASARGWASISAQEKRVEAQVNAQKERSKYLFEKANGSPEPKKISDEQSIYIGRSVWEQNSGQIASEIYKDLLDIDADQAKKFKRIIDGGVGGKKAPDAKQTAAIVDKYIMVSPRAQQMAIDIEKDYNKRYEMARGGLPTQSPESDDPFAQYAE